MIEPAASLRLQRVRDAYASDTGSRLADAPVARDLPAEPPLAEGYVAFRERAFGAEAVSAAFLATIASQAEALALVWEAHARGAVVLPPPVAAAVRAARAQAR
jgi:hypothetical protein